MRRARSRSGEGKNRGRPVTLRTVWEHVAEYIYVVEGERLSRVRVQIEPLSERHCREHVHYVHTAISEKGVEFVASVTEESYTKKMRDWQRMVSAAIR